MKTKSEDRAVYLVPQQDHSEDAGIIFKAIAILEGRMRVNPVSMSTPADVKDFLRLKYAETPHEIFSALWLDSQNRLIAHEELFRGTLNQAAVYPREVVKAGLSHNAAAVIFAHNHPSGTPDASMADVALTGSLKSALSLVDIKVLDHMIVGAMAVSSFAEQGRI